MKKTTLHFRPICFMFLFLCTGLSCTPDKQNRYIIQGELKDLPDGTVVELSYRDSLLNQTVIHNNTFEMQGVADKPIYVRIKAKDTENRKSFWLENSDISIRNTSKEFGSAKISGSKAQLDQDRYDIYKHDIKTRFTNVHQQLRIENWANDSLRSLLTTLFNERYASDQKWVASNSESPLSVRLTNVYFTQWERADIERLYDSIIPTDNNEELRKVIQHNLDLTSHGIEIGNTYTDFTQGDTSRVMKSLSDVKAQYTLLEFWASWCKPCREANPELKELYTAYHPLGLEIVSVSVDQNEDSWKKAIQMDGLPWVHLSDLEGLLNEAAIIYDVSAIPDNYLIDADGAILGRNLSVDEIEELINKS